MNNKRKDISHFINIAPLVARDLKKLDDDLLDSDDWLNSGESSESDKSSDLNSNQDKLKDEIQYGIPYNGINELTMICNDSKIEYIKIEKYIQGKLQDVSMYRCPHCRMRKSNIECIKIHVKKCPVKLSESDVQNHAKIATRLLFKDVSKLSGSDRQSIENNMEKIIAKYKTKIEKINKSSHNNTVKIDNLTDIDNNVTNFEISINYSHVKPRQLNQIFHRGIDSIFEIIRLVHFNANKPEYNNLRTNKKTNKYEIYKNGWITVNRKPNVFISYLCDQYIKILMTEFYKLVHNTTILEPKIIQDFFAYFHDVSSMNDIIKDKRTMILQNVKNLFLIESRRLR